MLVERAKAETVSPGGIEIPEQAQKKQTKGEVLMVGAGLKDEMGVDIQPGDIVIFSPYSGMAIEIEGDSLLILKADDVIMVVREEAANADTVSD
jgi:chaperonin GroES